MITVGIDEAGRGCWAGPLVAAAVILGQEIPGLDDSKKLSKKQREKLYNDVMLQAMAVGVGWVSAKEIDDIGLTAATKKAMEEAINLLGSPHDKIIIDGNFNYLPDFKNVKVVPKADSLFPSVSAASIVAKVERDKYMREIAPKYPNYQFERHVGYGTVLHHQLLKLHGVCDLHRLSYKPLQVLLKVSDVEL